MLYIMQRSFNRKVNQTVEESERENNNHTIDAVTSVYFPIFSSNSLSVFHEME